MITSKHRRLIILLISALFGLLSSLSLPAWSNSQSNTQATALRSLGEVLRKQGLLEASQKVLQLSLIALEKSPQSGVVLFSLGNTERTLGN